MSREHLLETDPRLRFTPFETADVPPDGIITTIKEHWWIVHETKGVVWWSSSEDEPPARWVAMSFKTKNHAQMMATKQRFPWASVRFMPLVFRRMR